MNQIRKLPIGNEFLPNLKINHLQKMLDSESNQKAKSRLQACILRKNGIAIRSIARKMNYPYTTVNDWLTKIHSNGLDAIYNKSGQGPKCRLSSKQLENLTEELKAGPNHCGFESKTWTVKLVCIHVKRMYKVKYTERGMYDLLARIGFSCRNYVDFAK